MTLYKMNEGLSESNRLMYKDIGPASTADGATWDIVLPDLAGTSALPIITQVLFYSPGAPGARNAVPLPELPAGSVAVGYSGTVYNEATGTITLQNDLGAALEFPEVYITVHRSTLVA